MGLHRWSNGDSAMSREPRASLSPEIVRKGEGAVREPLPEPPLNVELAPAAGTYGGDDRPNA
jgi:hypothetical protein